jgi:copper chaperone NosL
VKRILEREHRLLQVPVGWTPRALLAVAALLLVVAWAAPLWDMTMFAPQYPDGLRLHIYSSKLVGGNGGQDLKEINLLNHYIGMHDLAPENFTEFLWLPFLIGAIALLLLRAAFFGTIGHIVDVAVLFAYCALFSLWSFAQKLWAYGHELSPTAPVKVPGFMPPVFGRSQLANFEVYSYPGLGSYAFGAVGAVLVVALVLALRSARRDLPAGEPRGVPAEA